ncbi:MAG: putative zinc-binding metallopeptidase [Verrucomicrobiota bacterium]
MPENVTRWAALEAAKRRLVYSALRLKLPLANRVDDPQTASASASWPTP